MVRDSNMNTFASISSIFKFVQTFIDVSGWAVILVGGSDNLVQLYEASCSFSIFCLIFGPAVYKYLNYFKSHILSYSRKYLSNYDAFSL